MEIALRIRVWIFRPIRAWEVGELIRSATFSLGEYGIRCQGEKFWKKNFFQKNFEIFYEKILLSEWFFSIISRVQRLYTSPCRSIRPLVGWSVGNTFTFMPFWPPMSVPKSFLESLISFHKLFKKFSLKKFWKNFFLKKKTVSAACLANNELPQFI